MTAPVWRKEEEEEEEEEERGERGEKGAFNAQHPAIRTPERRRIEGENGTVSVGKRGRKKTTTTTN